MPTELHHHLDALQRDWALRILLLPLRFADDAHDNALRALIRRLGVSADWPKPDPLTLVRQSLAKSGLATPRDTKFPESLKKNLSLVQRYFDATPVARDLLGFAVLMAVFPFLRELCQLLPMAWETEIDAALAMVLGYQARDVTTALERGPLIDSGLLKAGGNGLARLSDRVVTEKLFATRMLAPATAVSELAENLISTVVAPDPDDVDFSYLPGQVALATAYLREAILSKRTGANILLIGSDGVGKTAFARSIAKALGKRLVKPSFADDRPYSSRDGRSCIWRAAQSLCSAEADRIFLFDELEDMPSTLRAYGKPWWRDVPMESTPVPTIWESSGVDRLDSAFVERFKLILYVDAPTGEERRKLLLRLTQGLSVKTCIEQWMNVNPLNIKALCRAINAVREAIHANPELNQEAALQTALTGFLVSTSAFDGRGYA